MIKKTTRWEKNKISIIALVVYIWLLLIIYTLQTNTSTADYKGWLLMIRSDFAGMLTLGGKVVNRNEDVTLRGAVLSVDISDEGWSKLLLEEYQSYLVKQGWRRNYSSPLTYCKRGALVTFFPQAGMRDKIGTNSIVMAYGANSKKTCGQMQAEVKK